MEVPMKVRIVLLPLLFTAVITFAGVKINYGVSTHQNRRPYQEDRFMHVAGNAGQFFGIYDGHGGAHVSELLTQKLHRYFAQAKGSIQQKFERAFEKADYEAQNQYPHEGSTALTIIVDKNDKAYFAWAGDTRAVLEDNGAVGFFTADHKPDRKDEKERIERAGGKIKMYGVWRVNGLAVSRSIGDASCKQEGVGQIIATPEYKALQLKENNHFLVMASDGLWDVMENEEVVAMVSAALRNNKSLNDIAQMLQNEAIKRGSGDNITVCVMQFDWQKEYRQPRESLMRRFWNWLQGK